MKLEPRQYKPFKGKNRRDEALFYIIEREYKEWLELTKDGVHYLINKYSHVQDDPRLLDAIIETYKAYNTMTMDRELRMAMHIKEACSWLSGLALIEANHMAHQNYATVKEDLEVGRVITLPLPDGGMLIPELLL